MVNFIRITIGFIGFSHTIENYRQKFQKYRKNHKMLIELVEVTDREPKKMFEGRFWGDRGFIHLCFDVQGVDVLRNVCKEKGYPFTVDTLEVLNGADFDMGDSSGMFAYIEDMGGTLIEFTEAYKIPLTKWFALKLKGRDPQKPLPNLLLKALKFKKYKE